MGLRTKEEQKNMSPQEARQLLIDGNRRFVNENQEKRSLSEERQHAAVQHPFATILSCIDSRVSAELVFDQGIGDLFSVRIAGNILNDDILGSIEFATEIVGTKLVLVLGHTSCGAIQGACAGVKLGHLTGLLEKIQPVIKNCKHHAKNDPLSEADFSEVVAIENVRQTVEAIPKQSPIIRQLIETNQILLAGAIYNIDTGVVEFLSD